MDKPRIKPLVWDLWDGGMTVAKTTIGTYNLSQAFRLRFPNGSYRYYETEEAAKVAAQADYEAHILAALEPVTDGPDWEGFGRDLLESWPVRYVDGLELFDAALRNGLIREIPGGYDPEQHIDAESICPEPGDPWYEYAFK